MNAIARNVRRSRRAHPASWSLARQALLLGACLALASCAAQRSIGPATTMPSTEEMARQLGLVGATPAAAPGAAPGAADAAAHAAAETAPAGVAPDWWLAYHDEELARWIGLALGSNPGLQEADARLARAQAALASAHAAGLPDLNLNADSTAERISTTGFFPPPIAGMVHTVNDLDLGAALELDLFGRFKSREQAARLGAQASALDRENLRIGLAGAVARTYFELARLQRIEGIVRDTELARARTLDLVQQRVRAGLDTQVDRRQSALPVPETRAEIERLREEITLTRHALAALAGQGPQAADAVAAHLPGAAALTPPATLTIDLLARRADIAAARRRVESTLQGVAAARADFYPNVSISAIVGLNSVTTQSLLEYGSRIWQIGPAVHLPLFEAGQLRAQLRAASADTDAAVAAYRDSVVRAAHEAADALASIAALARQRAQQQLATEHARAAEDLARTRRDAGLANDFAVLAAHGGELQQERAQAELDARAAALDVSLALALGGGFRDQP